VLEFKIVLLTLFVDIRVIYGVGFVCSRAVVCSTGLCNLALINLLLIKGFFCQKRKINHF